MKRQTGISFLGFLIVAVVVGFFALIGMKLFPLYMESYNVWEGMKTVAARPDIATLNTKGITRYLLRNYEVGEVRFLDEFNIRKHFKIERPKGKKGRVMHMTYESRRPLLGNLDVVLKFDKRIEIPPYRGN